MSQLKSKIYSLPKSPGIYIFRNQNGSIIYIGKALSLKNRVADYFRDKHPDIKTKKLVSQIADLDYQTVASEFDALLLEAKLIKEYQPKYNFRLKDSKRYLYIGITNPPFRIFPVRQPELLKLHTWFGPFPTSNDVRQVLKILRRLYPFCSCKNPPKRQCLYSHIKLCPGFQNLNTFNYKKNINKIRRILSAKSSKYIISDLKNKMQAASKKLEFEIAQHYKNQLSSFYNITQFWGHIPQDDFDKSKNLMGLRNLLIKYQGIDPIMINKIEGYDVSNLGKNIIVGAMVTFIQGQPEKSLYRKFRIYISPPGWKNSGYKPEGTPRGWLPGVKNLKKPSLVKSNDPHSIKQIISRRLNHPEWLYPQLILVDGGKGQVSATFQPLKEHELADQICLLGLAKKEETIVIPIIEKGKIVGWKMLKYSRRNPILQLLQSIRDESHRFSQKYYRQLHSNNLRIS